MYSYSTCFLRVWEHFCFTPYVFSVTIYSHMPSWWLFLLLFVKNIIVLSAEVSTYLFCSWKVTLSSLIPLPPFYIRGKGVINDFSVLKHEVGEWVWGLNSILRLMSQKWTTPQLRGLREFPESSGLCSIPSPHGSLWDHRPGYSQAGFRTQGCLCKLFGASPDGSIQQLTGSDQFCTNVFLCKWWFWGH